MFEDLDGLPDLDRKLCVNGGRTALPPKGFRKRDIL